MENEIVDGDQPLVVSPKKAAFLLDCGLDAVYALLHQGQLESYLEGQRRKITVRSIQALIAKRLADAGSVFQRSSRVPPPPKKKRKVA
jgi:hypothetical protein